MLVWIAVDMINNYGGKVVDIYNYLLLITNYELRTKE